MTGAPRLNLRDWAAAAEDVADPAAWEYLARGSGANVTATENAAAWSRWVLLPHVLRDVSTVDLSTTVLGTRIVTPIVVAPTAMHRFFTADGENSATIARRLRAGHRLRALDGREPHSVEDVAAAAPGWRAGRTMYMLRDRGRTRALAERAGSRRATARSWRPSTVPRSGAASRARRRDD